MKEDQKPCEDAELEALLDEDPSQAQKELASALGFTIPAISQQLQAMLMIQEQRPWVLQYLKPRDVEHRLLGIEPLLQRQMEGISTTHH